MGYATQTQAFPSIEEVIDSGWFKSRPKRIQEAIKQKPPTQLYRMDTGHVCRIFNYADTGKKVEATVIVLHVDNLDIKFERKSTTLT